MSTNKQKSLTLYDESIPFVDVYPDFDYKTLPSWIRENISNARVYGNNKKCLILPDGSKYHLNNSLNDMNGRDWTLFINSVFSTHYSTNGKESYAHNIRKIHPSPKPPQLMRDIIQFFTKENELVLDTFMGVGGTLLGAALCNRKAFGIELNKEYIDAYYKAANELDLESFPALCGDCISLLSDKKSIESITKNEKVSLLLIDPPYSNMMSKEKSGGDIPVYGKTSTPFTDYSYDLGNMSTSDFLSSLKESVELALPLIKRRGYIVIFIKDFQPHKKEVNLLHSDVINTINQISNVYYKGMKIWNDESTKPYPYGYPFCFVANQTHQYILVFRKEK